MSNSPTQLIGSSRMSSMDWLGSIWDRQAERRLMTHRGGTGLDTRTHTHSHTHTHSLSRRHERTRRHAGAHTHKHTPTHIHTHTQIQTHTVSHTYTYIHTLTQRHTHTHLCFLNGLLQLLLQTSDAGRGLDRAGRDLHGQLKVLANHIARLAAEDLKKRHAKLS